MANNLEYVVIIEQTDTRYNAYIPGCITVRAIQLEIKGIFKRQFFYII
ncbi:hypothetical protein Aasi_0117 [Candidatus Amoebophilus asiaticus 5a2]|uniref:Uncharacterized protein n=1 Tax=Amoebophilus asiaticus (strain 5a2) TaxID=452471 RepID=B3EUE6_AMOA5|nr:hypothetical protein Aasi_0117 [Candidatus Amoebophilus asiaticus 5a2]